MARICSRSRRADSRCIASLADILRFFTLLLLLVCLDEAIMPNRLPPDYVANNTSEVLDRTSTSRYDRG